MNNPLLDTEFLRELDTYRNRVIYARITSLTVDLYPIECIEGVVTDGSVTIDGNSAVRRVCSLTMTTKNVNLNNVYWGVTTRAKIEIGLEKKFEFNLNDLSSIEKTEILREKYKKYPDIIWFPLGIFILTDFKTSQLVNNYTITLTGKDKMCLLNGDIGGVFNAETDLGKEEILQEDGSYEKVYRSIPYIIREMVHHYAQEPFLNIVIKDINDLALDILRNNSDEDIYIILNKETLEIIEIINPAGPQEEMPLDYVSKNDLVNILDFSNLGSGFVFLTGIDEDNDSLINNYPDATIILKVVKNEDGIIVDSIDCTILNILSGEDIGYQYREMTYPEDLIAGIGETVTSILDKIVKQFGEYEYFYNLDGQFVFLAKLTYVNTSWNNIIRIENDETFVTPKNVSNKIKYHFEGSALTTAYQNTPNIGKVKNDYTVWGKKKSSSGIEIPIHSRYAIDLKPYFYKAFDGKIYLTEDHIDILELMDDSGNEYRKHGLPEYLLKNGGYSWWHIEDWQNYYVAVTDTVPTGGMMNYLASNNRGFTNDIHFINGLEGAEELIVAFKDVPSDPADYAENTIYIGRSPAFIFDALSSGLYLGYPVGWTGWDNESHYHNNVYRSRISSAFMHRFRGCGHKYDWFVDMAKRYGYDSYAYKPTIVDKSSVVHEDKILDDIIICDWREIIYQMAKDYYLHNHEDDYYYQLRLNNYMPSLNLALYQNGHTGYELYYHDIEGFWRLLYAPAEVYNWNTNELELDQSNYDLDNGGWNYDVTLEPANLLFWFDFFNADSLGLGLFSVPAIGDRPKVINNDAVRAIIYKDVPDIIFIKGSEYLKYENEQKLFDGYLHYKLTNDDDTESSFINDLMEETVPKIVKSTRGITALELIDDLLYNFGYCNENITITSVPIYYLEPNTIISAKDELRVVNGYYILNKMTIPLKYNGTMLINAIRVPERVY